MLSWIIQITIISILFIFLIDHLIKFFTNTLTVPKIKDLVNNPNKKYESIHELISNSSCSHYSKDLNKNETSTEIVNLPSSLKKEDKDSSEKMKNELKYFLKNQLKEEEINLTEYSSPEYFHFK